MDLDDMSVAGVSAWLARRSFSERVRAFFAENEIDGTALRSLLQDQAELKTALPIMGDRLRLKRAVLDDFCIGWIEGSSSSTTLSTSSTVGTPNEESSDVYEMLDVPGCLETETAADSDKEEREVQEDTPPPKKMKISASIPDPFVFPKIYPARIQQAVVSGKIYGTDRLAFIRYISDFMAGYSSFPSPSEYQRVACDIVEKYPCLADKLQGQPVWTTVKVQLSQRFRNIRSYSRKSFQSTGQGRRKARAGTTSSARLDDCLVANDADTSNESMSSDIVAYDRNVAKMKAECMSKTPNRQALTTL
ncbi:uncharacterized protein LOC134194569 [Corticium candelabrum]|uniref:uncharacterized protein LOC134194569 n=1 Tax=Corticium candelabrum TaxID=121492 RepID=UPI002E255A9D|nr:uncharacterized protein LOC134194569 [Corticium candelabrum]